MQITDKDALVQAIEGDRYSLTEAFTWGDTKQGHIYWADQYWGRTPLDVEALKTILAEEADEQTKPYDFFGIAPARFSDDELARLGVAVATELALRLSKGE